MLCIMDLNLLMTELPSSYIERRNGPSIIRLLVCYSFAMAYPAVPFDDAAHVH